MPNPVLYLSLMLLKRLLFGLFVLAFFIPQTAFAWGNDYRSNNSYETNSYSYQQFKQIQGYKDIAYTPPSFWNNVGNFFSNIWNNISSFSQTVYNNIYSFLNSTVSQPAVLKSDVEAVSQPPVSNIQTPLQVKTIVTGLSEGISGVSGSKIKQDKCSVEYLLSGQSMFDPPDPKQRAQMYKQDIDDGHGDKAIGYDKGQITPEEAIEYPLGSKQLFDLYQTRRQEADAEPKQTYEVCLGSDQAAKVIDQQIKIDQQFQQASTQTAVIDKQVSVITPAQLRPVDSGIMPTGNVRLEEKRIEYKRDPYNGKYWPVIVDKYKYGNYCGPVNADPKYMKPVIDSLDACCKVHDKVWEAGDQQARIRGDIVLHESVKALPRNPRQWQLPPKDVVSAVVNRFIIEKTFEFIKNVHQNSRDHKYYQDN